MDKSRLPPLEWIRAFEAAARLGSFTAAADESGLTQAAVSQRVGQLESRLGVALFHRRARGVTLSVEGEAWLPHVQVALGGLRDSAEALFGAAQTRLTISASQSIIELWLRPRLERLQTAVSGEISIQTLVVGAADAPQDDVVRIRYGMGDWPHPYRAPLYPEEIAPVVAPSLADLSTPWTELPRIDCVGPRPGWRTWSASFGTPITPLPLLRFDTHAAALGAALDGRGVLLASLPLCRAHLDRGALVRIDDRSLAHHESYWVLGGPDAVSRPQWSALIQALGSE